MIFPHSFYEDEIRCDFVIPSMIKRTWAAQIEILTDVDRACSRNGLQYFADWGTLLGTVRHGGFIPWDDDMDICMKRGDYDRFVNDVSAFLTDNYSIVNFRSSRDFKQMSSRIVSSDHYRFDPEYMHKYSGLPFALGIDIFPMDYLTDDEEYERKREEKIMLVQQAVDELTYFDTDPADIRDHLRKIERTCGMSLDMKADVLTQLRGLLERLFSEVDEKDAKYITIFPLWLNRHTYRFPVSYYEKSIRMPFEGTSVCVPVYYDSILKKKYGTSYMRQIRSRGAHDYPYCDEHIRVLKEHFGFEWPTYRFSEADLVERTEKYRPSSGGRCLFITYSPRAFENMRSLVTSYSDDGYEVTVHPVAKYDIAPDMAGITPSTEKAPDEYYTGGSDRVNVTYDPHILDSHPDIIVTNYPYDEYNMITAVDKIYYSRALRKHSGWLVYVPPFEAGPDYEDDLQTEKTMPSYVCTPMAALCDEMILHSNQMKRRYVDCLTAFSGDKYRDIWENKITVHAVSSENTDKETKGSDSGSEEKKRRIMFYIGLSSFAEHGPGMIDKIRSVFEIFEKTSDRIDVVFKVQEGLADNLRDLYPDVYKEYMACGFRESEDGIDINEIDAYYGEASVYATQFINEHKPVMICR